MPVKKRVHELKCWPEPFAALLDGRKRFEVRVDDRGFAVGDVLVLHEWDPYLDRHDYSSCKGEYTQRDPVRMLVTYILHGGRFGLPEDVCVMSVEPDGSQPVPP